MLRCLSVRHVYGNCVCSCVCLSSCLWCEAMSSWFLNVCSVRSRSLGGAVYLCCVQKKNLKRKTLYSYLQHSFQMSSMFVGPAGSPNAKRDKEASGRLVAVSASWIRTDWRCDGVSMRVFSAPLRTCTQAQTVPSLWVQSVSTCLTSAAPFPLRPLCLFHPEVVGFFLFLDSSEVETPRAPPRPCPEWCRGDQRGAP